MASSLGISLQPVYALPGLPASPLTAGHLQGGLLQAVLLDKDGRELARHPLEWALMADEEDDGIAVNIGRFDSLLPLPETPVAVVQIYQGDSLVAERSLSLSKPAALPLQAAAGAEGAELTWRDDNAPVLLRASFDGGQSWQVLAVDLTGGRYLLHPEWFPEQEILFQIFPADQGSLERDAVWSIEVDLSLYKDE
jgi:hypothetical protein